MSRRAIQDDHHKRVQQLRTYNFDPRLSKVYLSAESEVPASISNMPRRCQRAYIATFNNNLKRWGEVTFAMKAAVKAARATLEYLKDQARKASIPFDRYVEWKENNRSETLESGGLIV